MVVQNALLLSRKRAIRAPIGPRRRRKQSDWCPAISVVTSDANPPRFYCSADDRRHAPIKNSVLERYIRPFCAGRKSWLFPTRRPPERLTNIPGNCRSLYKVVRCASACPMQRTTPTWAKLLARRHPTNLQAGTYFFTLKIATASPYGKPSWKLPPAATAMYCSPLTV
jgi:hypothetical protein